MPLDDDDYNLSMKISRRAHGEAAGDRDLRSLLVHRLTVTLKAVLRRPLGGGGKFSLYCEFCDRWESLVGAPAVASCSTCERLFRLEFAIYEEVEQPDGR
jgi:hypothetical protein